ncbi:hypothetical protein AGDE_04015 [Angomonas deanei]|nr:hypothetical protein AGDE_04015 [Angomonas deanei]|eukprot:EPY39913.1 hypothetical protein AGDE_04015 [Angomonas deanei]
MLIHYTRSHRHNRKVTRVPLWLGVVGQYLMYITKPLVHAWGRRGGDLTLIVRSGLDQVLVTKVGDPKRRAHVVFIHGRTPVHSVVRIGARAAPFSTVETLNGWNRVLLNRFAQKNRGMEQHSSDTIFFFFPNHTLPIFEIKKWEGRNKKKKSCWGTTHKNRLCTPSEVISLLFFWSVVNKYRIYIFDAVSPVSSFATECLTIYRKHFLSLSLLTKNKKGNSKLQKRPNETTTVRHYFVLPR